VTRPWQDISGSRFAAISPISCSLWAVLGSESVALPSPVHRFSCDGIWDFPPIELTLGFVKSVTALDQAQGKSSSTGAMFVAGRAGLDEAEMLGRQLGW
jgi:hypothetical protein